MRTMTRTMIKKYLRRRIRYTWLPEWAYALSEKVAHPHVPEERPELFEAYNTGTTELEVLNWLHATILVLKPERVLETGAADGLGTIALADACRRNGLGRVHSVEIDPERCERLQLRLRAEGLAEYVEVHSEDSIDFLRRNETVFDIGFFDSMCELRAREFATCLNRGTIGRLAVFHDTSARRCESLKGWPSDAEHARYREDLFRLAGDPRCTGYFESPFSRGFVCIFVRPPAYVSTDPVPGSSQPIVAGA